MCVYIYRCVTAHTGARYNTLNGMKEWPPVGVRLADSLCTSAPLGRSGPPLRPLLATPPPRRRGWGPPGGTGDI